MASAPCVKGPAGGNAPAANDSATAKGSNGASVTDDHLLTLPELAAKFETHVDFEQPKRSRGLSTVEATARLVKYGRNALTPPKTVPQWIKYLIKLSNPLLLMIIGSGILSLITYGVDTSVSINLWLGWILCPVAFGTAVMTGSQVGHGMTCQVIFYGAAAVVILVNVARKAGLQRECGDGFAGVFRKTFRNDAVASNVDVAQIRARYYRS